MKVQPEPVLASDPSALPTGESKRVPSLRMGNGSVSGDTPAAGFPEFQVCPKSFVDGSLVVRLKLDFVRNTPEWRESQGVNCRFMQIVVSLCETDVWFAALDSCNHRCQFLANLVPTGWKSSSRSAIVSISVSSESNNENAFKL